VIVDILAFGLVGAVPTGVDMASAIAEEIRFSSWTAWAVMKELLEKERIHYS
jgi:hypothetical protein